MKTKQMWILLFLVIAGLAFRTGVMWAKTESQSLPVVPRGATVLSGPDIGFVVEGRDDIQFTGRLVIKLQGNWHKVRIVEP